MIIKIKSWDEMKEEFGLEDYHEATINTTAPFTEEMKYLCGREFETERLGNKIDGYYKIDGYHIGPDMYTVIEDNVNHPDHYNQGEYEVIEVIKDLKKAMFYLYREIEKGEC